MLARRKLKEGAKALVRFFRTLPDGLAQLRAAARAGIKPQRQDGPLVGDAVERDQLVPQAAGKKAGKVVQPELVAVGAPA